MLRQEIEQLKYKVDHHPDVTRFAMENLDLKGKSRGASSPGPPPSPGDEARSGGERALTLS